MVLQDGNAVYKRSVETGEWSRLLGPRLPEQFGGSAKDKAVLVPEDFAPACVWVLSKILKEDGARPRLLTSQGITGYSVTYKDIKKIFFCKNDTFYIHICNRKTNWKNTLKNIIFLYLLCKPSFVNYLWVLWSWLYLY